MTHPVPHPRLRSTLRIALPVLVVALGAGGATAIWLTRPQVDTISPAVPPPLVEVRTLGAQSLRMEVSAHGTVEPSTATALIAEVPGRIVEVSESLAGGGFFSEGEVLVRIEPRDFEIAVVRAKAALAGAEVALEVERAEAEAAIEEWKTISDQPASELVRRVPQLQAAEARVEAARAEVEAAERDLARTEIRAPYAGRVSRDRVDLGQFVTRGTPVADVYAVDYAEIRLPLQDRDLAFVDLPVDFRDASHNTHGPEVTIRANFAGAIREWHGRIVRTEGEIDRRSRMVHAIARVEDPYGSADDNGSPKPPLLVGLFVEAIIAGIEVDSVFVVPRASLYGRNRVLVVDSEDRIRVREVEILRAVDDVVFVRNGLADGDRLTLTRLDAYSDGMAVRTRPAGVSDEVSER